MVRNIQTSINVMHRTSCRTKLALAGGKQNGSLRSDIALKVFFVGSGIAPAVDVEDLTRNPGCRLGC